MLFSAKHRVMLWVPSLIFICLVLGSLERDRFGELIYRVFTGGFWSSVLLFVAVLLIPRGERVSFYLGITCWILAILVLLLVERSTLLIIHL
jgi:hypothetical protein